MKRTQDPPSEDEGGAPNRGLIQSMSEETKGVVHEGLPEVEAEATPGPAGKPWVQEFALGLAVAGWILPGLGHALQRMWARAVVIFAVVGLLVFVGAEMRGNIFTAKGSDAFDTLGYVADLGTGSFYFFARSLEKGGAETAHANGDYGTRFLATAGILNLLAALHAYEAARGRKA